MAPRDVDNLLQHLLRIERAGRVVRVNNDDRLGLVGDLLLHICNVRIPLRLLIADVMHGRSAGQVDAGRPERVIRRRNKHLVPIVEQRVHAQLNQLTDTIARVNIVDIKIRQILQLSILHDGLSRCKQAVRVRISFRLGQLRAHVLYDFIRCPEAERGWITDAELQDMNALRLHPVRLIEHWSSYIIQHVVEFG